MWLSTSKILKNSIVVQYLILVILSLSPGQTDSQVLASSGKLNLRRDLRWMAKRTGKFPRKCTKVAKKKSYFKARGSVTELALTWVGWPNGKKLALTCGQI